MMPGHQRYEGRWAAPSKANPTVVLRLSQFVVIAGPTQAEPRDKALPERVQSLYLRVRVNGPAKPSMRISQPRWTITPIVTPIAIELSFKPSLLVGA